MSALKGRALAAYLVVCIVWGSTYLAIRIGVGELPPFLFAGLRFLVAGGLLAALALALGDHLPRRAVDWRTAAIVGVLLLGGGNSFVVWAEQYTASGVASLFVVTVALWMAFFDAVIPGGTGELNWRVVVGLVAGFIGTALLVGASPHNSTCRCSRSTRTSWTIPITVPTPPTAASSVSASCGPGSRPRRAHASWLWYATGRSRTICASIAPGVPLDWRRGSAHRSRKRA